MHGDIEECSLFIPSLNCFEILSFGIDLTFSWLILPDNFGTAMLLVKSDIGGNITVSFV